MNLDGKIASANIKLRLAGETQLLIKQGRKAPHLCAILVGHNGASETYVASKVKNCEEVGFRSSLIRYPDTVSEKELLDKIDAINKDGDIDGLIVQLPLPAHINPQKICEAITPSKDVDGFHPLNAGRLLQNLPCYIPATPFGILMMLEHYQVRTSGLHAVVVGRSNIVGMPMSVLLGRNSSPGNCTVTLCHSKTRDMNEILRSADLVVAALGKPGFIGGDMVKDGVIVIDVGITRVPDATKKSGYRISGDVNFEEVAPKASWITPVPGGVGLMTICGLLMNTLRSAKGEVTF